MVVASQLEPVTDMPHSANRRVATAAARGVRRLRGLRDLLVGGDRRSIARGSAALRAVLARPAAIAEIAALAKDEDWLVSLRALDLLDKVAHQHANWVQPYKHLFIGPLADSEQWERRLQVVRTLPQLRWTPRERLRAIAILRRDATHPQLFVRAWALDSLATFAQGDLSLEPTVERLLRAFEKSGRPALKTRARHIRQRLLAHGGVGALTVDSEGAIPGAEAT